jgi:hypothetical protein
MYIPMTTRLTYQIDYTRVEKMQENMEASRDDNVGPCYSFGNIYMVYYCDFNYLLFLPKSTFIFDIVSFPRHSR